MYRSAASTAVNSIGFDVRRAAPSAAFGREREAFLGDDAAAPVVHALQYLSRSLSAALRLVPRDSDDMQCSPVSPHVEWTGE